MENEDHDDFIPNKSNLIPITSHLAFGRRDTSKERDWEIKSNGV